MCRTIISFTHYIADWYVVLYHQRILYDCESCQINSLAHCITTTTVLVVVLVVCCYHGGN